MQTKKLYLGLVLIIASINVLSAPNVANTNQKGSLLIFPRIDVAPNRTTVVHITNDQTDPVDVSCYYMDWNKEKHGFHFTVTKTQPLWFDVSSGEGSIGAGAFRTLPNPAPGADPVDIHILNNSVTQSVFPGWRGELMCWATTYAGDNQLLWNHLAGTVTIYEFDTKSAYEYTAWALYAHRGAAFKNIDGVPGKLVLEGADGTYDYCPKYLIGQYTPQGKSYQLEDTPGNTKTVTYERTQLSIASCTQDLRQDWEWITTKLEFETWDRNEIKRTGAYECSDSWHEVYLDNGVNAGGYDVDADDHVSTGGFNFMRDTLTAYYRVRGTASTRCDETIRNGLGEVIRRQLTRDVGLVGVQLSSISMGDGEVRQNTATVSPLHASGQMKGVILWDPEEDHTSKN